MKWLSKPWHLAVMVLPALAFYGVYLVYPVLYSLYYSFTNYTGLGAATLNGGANYATMVHDPFFWSSLRNTGIILAIALLVLVPGAFLVAVLLSGDIRGSGLLRAMLFAPAIVAPILVGLIWVFILDPSVGLVNAFLAAIGIPNGPKWIGGTTLSPFSFGIVFVWEQLGFIATIFYAGLKLLPSEVLEASAIDGATRRQQLRYVTVPMLSETFNICTVLVITGVFKIFELVYVLTGGGPVHVSDVLVSYMYYITFTVTQYGYGMTLAVVIFALGVVVSVGYLMLSRRRRYA
jgi:raffinose/stachyose/melibiose transport system permease protein